MQRQAAVGVAQADGGEIILLPADVGLQAAQESLRNALPVVADGEGHVPLFLIARDADGNVLLMLGQAVIDGVLHQGLEQSPGGSSGIRVVLNLIPYTEAVMQTRAQTAEMPGMFNCATSTMYEIMFADGMILDLTGQPFLSNVQESTLAAYEGRNWHLPYSLSYYGLYVRTDISRSRALPIPQPGMS